MIVRPAALAFLATAALGLFGAASFADPPAGAPPSTNQREVWVIETGDAGAPRERREIDVTDMSEALRKETVDQLTAVGWRIVERKRVEAAKPPVVAPRPYVKPPEVVVKPPEVVVNPPEVVVKPPEIVVTP